MEWQNVHHYLLKIGGVMNGVLEAVVHEDRAVRQSVQYALKVRVREIMQGYEDSRKLAHPKSKDEDYLFGWYMSGKNRRSKR